MKHELNQIIKELKEVVNDQDLRITDDCLFVQACSFLRGVLASNARKSYQKPSNSVLEPSQKQIDFLNKHKVKIPKTKKEATKLIKDYIENLKTI